MKMGRTSFCEMPSEPNRLWPAPVASHATTDWRAEVHAEGHAEVDGEVQLSAYQTSMPCSRKDVMGGGAGSECRRAADLAGTTICKRFHVIAGERAPIGQ